MRLQQVDQTTTTFAEAGDANKHFKNLYGLVMATDRKTHECSAKVNDVQRGTHAGGQRLLVAVFRKDQKLETRCTWWSRARRKVSRVAGRVSRSWCRRRPALISKPNMVRSARKKEVECENEKEVWNPCRARCQAAGK